jgi:nucleotide-binding universal stress UspA family protein
MTVPLRRVLACVQFNESQQTTVGYACALAERFHAELHLLHVFEQPPEPDVAALSPDEASYSAGGAEAVLAGVVPAGWEERLICRRAVAFGVPWMEIIHYAWEHEIDTIVVGGSSRSALGRWIWGSVADQLVHRPPCPVVVVPHPPERRFPLP